MFEKVSMKINTVEVQNQGEHGLRSNFMNLLYTNQSTKETVMETSCYCPDTGDMECGKTNVGFGTRFSFFADPNGEKTDPNDASVKIPLYKYKDNPITFQGSVKLIIKFCFICKISLFSN